MLPALRRFDDDAEVVAVACQAVLNTCNSGAAATWDMVESGMLTQLTAALERYGASDVLVAEEVCVYGGRSPDPTSSPPFSLSHPCHTSHPRVGRC